MYQNTRFHDFIKGLSRSVFNKMVQRHQSDKHSKGFGSWDHLIAMVYCQVSGASSLRELEAGFNSQAPHHYHLGTRAIKRSTLCDANANRPAAIFEDVCKHLMQSAHRKLKNDLDDLLYLIDSSGITLKGQGFDDWTAHSRSGRIQGLKIHTVYAPETEVPARIDITQGEVSDVEMGKVIPIEKGATYVFDKGYYDYNWWFEIENSGAHFVSRFKKNAAIQPISCMTIHPDERDVILEDSIVEFSPKSQRNRKGNDYVGTRLRRIVVHREDKSTPLILVSNDFTRSATEVADLYKRRWAIELFFKWLKQNLKIKKFLGRNENAVKVQIYTALITYLLLKIRHQTQGATCSLKMFMAELRSTLFQKPRIEWEKERMRRIRAHEFAHRQGCLWA